MRILHVFEIGLVGGAFRVVEALSKAQRQTGTQAAVLAVAEGEKAAQHPILDSLRDCGVTVVPVVLDRSRAYLRERREVVAAARRLDVDVVHSHGYRADVVDGTAARRAGYATVSTLHGFTGGDFRGRLYEKLQRWAVARGDAVVAVSEPMREQLLDEGFPGERLHVVPNAILSDAVLASRVEAREALGLDPEGFRVGWVGRMSGEKAPDLMLAALAALGSSAPPVSMVGDGPLRSRLEEDSPSRVTWHGVVHGADTLLRAFDVVALTSRTEGTPMVILEAMRAGVPIIATRVGGVPNVLTEQEALLVPPADPQAITAAIRNVMDDPASARDRAARARSRLEREFDPDRWVERYQRVYESALAVRADRTARG